MSLNILLIFSLKRHYMRLFESAIIYSCIQSTSKNMFSENLGELSQIRKLKNISEKGRKRLDLAEL